MLIQKEFKSITRLSNQGIGTLFWDLGYAKLILNYVVWFCLFTKIWLWNWRKSWLWCPKSIKKAEICIIINVNQAVMYKRNSCHIIEWRKHDSYSFVLCRKNCKVGLQKFWIRYDIEDHTRYLPIDFMIFCSNLWDAHILAGHDLKNNVVSKV